ncbi:MAG TPA: 2-oxoacid ferredoxin oxidoreductase, partial [Acidimicrobiaceae bacterium]|nr:2-oxoacid ferredoxin oxidoreductase [Acidimicrobiaceae bacterium]
GIGCHTMVLLLRPGQAGDIAGLTSMGQEGTQWIGMAPFVETPHIYQNLGDGTYFHSGRMAIAGAVAAGVDITYKLLWNRHVAMTGGQDPSGAGSVGDVCRTLLATGVARVLITSEKPSAYDRRDLPAGVDVWDRRRMIEAQELLAAVDGVTVLVHDQQCAAEARRGRKRGTIEIPPRRVVINERVCEGCGDCARISNCLSVQPVDTFFGAKTRIDQTSCNLDFSCLEGDCPSFTEVRKAGPLRLAVREMLAAWGLGRHAHDDE